MLIWSESWEYQDKFVGVKCKHKPMKIDVMDVIETHKLKIPRESDHGNSYNNLPSGIPSE
jgi:hypothetical protein